MLVCLTKAGRSKLLLCRKLGKPLTGGRAGGCCWWKERDEPGPATPTSPCRQVRKMGQEERNMLQSKCSCGTSVQEGCVIHRTSCGLREKGPRPLPCSWDQLRACSAVQRSWGGEMPVMLTTYINAYTSVYCAIKGRLLVSGSWGKSSCYVLYPVCAPWRFKPFPDASLELWGKVCWRCYGSPKSWTNPWSLAQLDVSAFLPVKGEGIENWRKTKYCSPLKSQDS